MVRAAIGVATVAVQLVTLKEVAAGVGVYDGEFGAATATAAAS